MGVPPELPPMFVSTIYSKQWVTLHSWVYHLDFSLCLLALPIQKIGRHCTRRCATLSTVHVCYLNLRKTLGYTALMGVPLNVQLAMFASST